METLGFEVCSLLGFSQLTLRRASSFGNIMLNLLLGQWASCLLTTSPIKQVIINFVETHLLVLRSRAKLQNSGDFVPMVVWSFGLHALGLSLSEVMRGVNHGSLSTSQPGVSKVGWQGAGCLCQCSRGRAGPWSPHSSP